MRAKVCSLKVQAERISKSVHSKGAHFFFWWCISKCGPLPNGLLILWHMFWNLTFFVWTPHHRQCFFRPSPSCRWTVRKWSKLIVMTCSKTIWTAYLETPIQGPLLLGHFYKTLKVVCNDGWTRLGRDMPPSWRPPTTKLRMIEKICLFHTSSRLQERFWCRDIELPAKAAKRDILNAYDFSWTISSWRGRATNEIFSQILSNWTS